MAMGQVGARTLDLAAADHGDLHPGALKVPAVLEAPTPKESAPWNRWARLCQRETMARVAWRLLPMLMLCYFVAFFDRTSVRGFLDRPLSFFDGGIFRGRVLVRRRHLLLRRCSSSRSRATSSWPKSARAHGFRASPATWGIIFLGLTAPANGGKLFVLRHPLRARAGGGGILPRHHRVSHLVVPERSIARASSPCSWRRSDLNMIGSVVSGTLLDLDGMAGLAGWQWLFILEALPAIVLGFVFYFVMTDRPEDARWLTPEQRQWLIARLAAERGQREAIRNFGLGEALRNPRVLLLATWLFRRAPCRVLAKVVQPADRRHQPWPRAGARSGLINARRPDAFAASPRWCCEAFYPTARASGQAVRHRLSSCTGLIACAFMTDPFLTMAMLVIAAIWDSLRRRPGLIAADRHAVGDQRRPASPSSTRSAILDGVFGPACSEPDQGRDRQLHLRSRRHCRGTDPLRRRHDLAKSATTGASN